MTRLDSIFYIKNGVASSNLQVHSEKTENRIAYIRPSNPSAPLDPYEQETLGFIVSTK